MTRSRALDALNKGLWVTVVVSAWICVMALGGLVGLPILAPELVNAVSVVPLFAITALLILSAMRAEKGRRAWAITRAIVLPPLVLIVLVVWGFLSGLPGVVNRVTLSDGRQFLLGVGPEPSDIVYVLWQSVDRWGVFWRPTKYDLTYSDDGTQTADPALVVDPNGRRLLVRRGGLWTDCLDIETDIRACASKVEEPSQRDSESWRARSEDIERLVGLHPTASR